MVGRAITIECLCGPEMTYGTPGKMIREEYKVYDAWDAIQPGDVVIASAGGWWEGNGTWGDCICAGFMAKGAVGLVTDGLVRDAPYITKMAIPCFTWMGLSTPRVIFTKYDGVTHCYPTRVNVPIVCDGVRVNPGDIIMGDQDCVLCVPKERADLVAEIGVLTEEIEEKYSRALAEKGLPLRITYGPVEQNKYYRELGLLEKAARRAELQDIIVKKWGKYPIHGPKTDPGMDYYKQGVKEKIEKKQNYS
jgi:4-hydroxy-4-methyl-2-oxoglutarate aldolase